MLLFVPQHFSNLNIEPTKFWVYSYQWCCTIT